nr:hypothetical protein Q903MT_gene3517 [Picea sitchensis]
MAMKVGGFRGITPDQLGALFRTEKKETYLLGGHVLVVGPVDIYIYRYIYILVEGHAVGGVLSERIYASLFLCSVGKKPLIINIPSISIHISGSIFHAAYWLITGTFNVPYWLITGFCTLLVSIAHYRTHYRSSLLAHLCPTTYRAQPLIEGKFFRHGLIIPHRNSREES